MSKKYVVTIMDRHYIGEGNYIFSTNHVAIGEIDEQTGIFNDRYGNRFAPMTSKGILESDVPYAYGNTRELAILKESLGKDATLSQAIAEYEYLCRKNVFFVGTTDDNEVFIVSDLDDKIDVYS